MRIALLLSLLCSASLFAQMEVGSVWKVSGNTAIGLEGLGIDSTKIHFLGSGVFQISYEQGGNPATETSTWHDLSANSIMVTYDPAGAAFGVMCPDDSTSFVYSINSNTMTLSNIQGSCSSAASILNNSTWQKVGGTSMAGLSDFLPGSLSAYPNPTHTVLTLVSSNIIFLDAIKVYSLLGKEETVNGNQLSANSLGLDVSAFSPGWYLVQAANGQFLRFEVR
jgi:hypothetical protein